jgi:hypothetical protein
MTLSGARRLREHVEGLAQGVSQRPAYQRRPGQAERMVNIWPSPFFGADTRRPDQFINRLANKNGGVQFTPYMEWVNVSDSEHYLLTIFQHGDYWFLGLFRDGQYRVPIDPHGVGLTQNVPAIEYPDGDPTNWVVAFSTSYLAGSGHRLKNHYALSASGALSLLSNRGVPTAMLSDLSPVRPPEALVFIQAVSYSTTYTLTIDGISVSHTTPKSTDDPNVLSTSDVAAALVAAWSDTDYELVQDRYVIWVKRADNGDFQIELDDGNSGVLGRAIKDRVTSVVLLPLLAPEGFQVIIDSTPEVEIDDRWYRFRTAADLLDNAIGEGAWEETVAPGVPIRIDANTMPLVLRRAAEDAFFIGPADGAERTLVTPGGSYNFTFPAWGERTAGNEESAPDPRFIGRPIKDLALFRQRLVTTAGQGLKYSEIGDPFNFFPGTIQAVLATGPFDLPLPTGSGSELEWLLVVGDSHMAFSLDTQYAIYTAGDGESFGVSTAVITRTNQIDQNVTARPVLSALNVLFPSREASNYTTFREYQFDARSNRGQALNLGDATNLMLEVPKLIPGDADQWVVSQTKDYMAVTTPERPNSIFIYKYLWRFQAGGGLQRVQQAWGEWQFSRPVRNLAFNQDTLSILTFTEADGYGLSHLDAQDLQDAALPEVALDRRISFPECNLDQTAANDVIATYDPDENVTTFDLPYSAVSPCVAIVKPDSPVDAWLKLGEIEGGSVLRCQIPGDFTQHSIYIGEKCLFEYTFSTAYRTRRTREGQVASDTNGNMQLLTWEVEHFNAGFYEVVVERKNRPQTTSRYRARRLNVMNNRLTTERDFLETDVFRVPVQAKNTECSITVRSETYLPFTITGATWEGTYSNRSR